MKSREINFEGDNISEQAEDGPNFEKNPIGRDGSEKLEPVFFKIGEKRIKLGDFATVITSSGEIERDWVLSDFDSENVHLSKITGNGESSEKIGSIEEFFYWQTK